MDEILFTQKYYYYLIVFISALVFFSFQSYLKNKYWSNVVNVATIIFSSFTIYYFGTREMDIGTDTSTYYRAFRFYELSDSFVIRKDPFFDIINYSFAKIFDFTGLLIFCAFLYVFGFYFGLRKIFKDNFYLPFIIFLISPYFMAWGVNVMRNGVAAALFLVAVGLYYNRDKNWKIILWFFGSILFHISMLVPLIFVIVTRYFTNTKLIFFMWLGSIVLAVLNINIIAGLMPIISSITDRAGDYATNQGERNAWANFLIFGFFPVIFSNYNIVVLKYNNNFYKRVVNAYMLTHILYIILINTYFALRIGYLAEFMMPVLLLFPLLVDPLIDIKYKRLKLCIIIFVVFLVKAYKILIV